METSNRRPTRRTAQKAAKTSTHPSPLKPLREAFKAACREAGLKPIEMYDLRHSFGTSLAAKGIDVRTIQAPMRRNA
ncbi:MAG TPA: tyrosine-type recombinase/integrase [Solirubrobacteraceae bacterium]|nr:tyrosine-type recombinase/integrase [Solirubrobacteraceae bacterium]